MEREKLPYVKHHRAWHTIGAQHAVPFLFLSGPAEGCTRFYKAAGQMPRVSDHQGGFWERLGPATASFGRCHDYISPNPITSGQEPPVLRKEDLGQLLQWPLDPLIPDSSNQLL